MTTSRVIEGRYILDEHSEWTPWRPIVPEDIEGNYALNLLLGNDPDCVIMKQLHTGTLIQWRYASEPVSIEG